MTGALDGTKVLDLTRLLPGPFASLVLADLGARVDKIEDTGTGDYLRHIPPLVGDTSALFLALNRDKRSACLDLKKEGGRRAFLKLVESYDVVLEQFRPGVLERLGVGHTLLLEKNPRLVVCAITGYGQDGPLAGRAGHDLNYLARSGVLGMQGPAGGAPQIPGFQLADVGGSLWCVIGILAALAERARTGKGRIVDISMTEGAIGFGAVGYGDLFAGQPAPRGKGPVSGGRALYSVYETKGGGYVTLAALEPKFWTAFCEAVGLEADDRAYWPGPHQDALKAKVAEVFRSKTRKEWESFARKHDCCIEPVLEPAEATRDAHLRARGAFFDLMTPWGPTSQLRTPMTSRAAEHAPPPRQGEHTDAILREAGFDDAAIAALRGEGAVT